MRKVLALCALAIASLGVAAIAGATANNTDTLVTNTSPPTPFSQNKQNEPAVAVNPIAPTMAAAGANEEIDMEACNNRSDTTCPFTPGVGVSGIYFLDPSSPDWQQPTYQGWTARQCLGLPGTSNAPADNCDPHAGSIGTLPNYYEHGFVSDGDPALGFGPQRGANGRFSWTNGWRLYYANITSSFSGQRSEQAFKGFEAVAVSRLDSQDYADAKLGINGAWKDPVVVSKQNSALFSDHEMLAVDDAAETSRFFGNVYICDAAFRSQEIGGFPEPIVVNASSDGGETWQSRQVSPAFDNSTVGGRQDCAVNTDSQGNVYVFWDGTDPKTKSDAIFMARSSDGGRHFGSSQLVTHFDGTGIRDPESGDLTFDGVAGARDGSFPTVDIANGAPTGVGASDEILLGWSNGPTPSDASPGPNEQVRLLWSLNQGKTWTSGGVASPSSDRPDFPAIAISPDGRDAYVTYMSFTSPWQSTTASPRLFRGVVRHAEVDRVTGAVGMWSDLNRAPTGDARGSSANALTDEFLGDYDYAFATNDFVTTVWNDARDAADCTKVDIYRQRLVDGTSTSDSTDSFRPAPQQDCTGPSATFGNTNIYGGSYADPTSP